MRQAPRVFAQLPDRFAWGQHNSFFISEFRLLVDRLLLLLHGVGLPLVNHNFHEILLFIRYETITDFNWFFSRNVFVSFCAPAHSWFKSDSINELASLELNFFFYQRTATTTNRSIIVRRISKEPCWAHWLIDRSCDWKWSEERSQQTREKKEICNENQLALYLRIFNMKLWDKVNEIKVKTRIERKVNPKMTWNRM